MFRNCFSLVLAVTLSSNISLAAAAERPNVLLILVDDLKPSFGAYGVDWVKSPNLDRLAAKGMRFDMAYCNQAVCAPSRNNLLIGSRSTSIGVYSLGQNFRTAVPDAVTMPQYFKNHGYHSAGIGKVFHVGHGNVNDESSWSVPFQPDKVVDYVLPESTGGQLTREEAYFSNQKLGDIRSLPRGAAWENADVDDEAYADGRIATEGIKRLKSYSESKQPFFLALGFTKPHLPFCAPKKYWDMYDRQQLPLAENVKPPEGAPSYAGKTLGELSQYKPVPENPPLSEDMTRTLIHGYYAALSYMDAQVGRVLQQVETLGLDDNTIIVLWGDHGYHLGDHGSWTKHTNYEQANRIPIFVVAPGVTTPGTSSSALIETVDIFPTVAELAGLPAISGPQPIDGSSFVNVLNQTQTSIDSHAYHCFPKGGRLGRAIRTERYRLVEWKSDKRDDKPEFELYDYKTDPHETKNLASSQPEVAERLKAILATHPEAIVNGGKPKDSSAATTVPTSASEEAVSPSIANTAISISVEAEANMPNGVLLAQGGREHGFALLFVDGQPTFDVRVDGKVTRLQAPKPKEARFKLSARLAQDEMTLQVDGQVAETCASPGFIPVQPKDGLSLAKDDRSAAGNYEAPNPFNGTLFSTKVQPDGDKQPAVVAEPMSRAEIEAGLQSHDKALFVHNSWIRDPYIVRGPDDFYYLTGTTPQPKDPVEVSDPYNTGLGNDSIVGWQMQVWRSKDLVEWSSLGAPFNLKDGVWAEARPDKFKTVAEQQWRLWAPELHWLGDRWALVHTSPSPVAAANLSLTANSDVQRPWSNPMGSKIGKRHDPSLFKDDDGTWWMIWGATQIAPLNSDFSDFTAAPVAIGPSGDTSRMGHEGCLMRKIDGKYVLFGTGWSTSEMRKGSYNLYYATADSITGPYSERKFAGRFLGHGTPFQDREGQWWSTAFYNGNVPPISRDGVQQRDLSETAQTINQRGTTLVPLDVQTLHDGTLHIRAKVADYAVPGPDEAQSFNDITTPQT
ncbi:MAG: sulfatase-like hydrolase/transferase [Fuerstiella sp.]